ncbi:hypothetical protein [Mycoplasmoides alvi]|uniref:hypothetical protein n=1 Tax=Mycoplasmoides alvi TaxID=78580 RepID=UPI00051BC3E4|nr:hypothetical protein [Mycoplasmoides alvi]
MTQDWLSTLSIHTGNKWADFNINSAILSGIIILIPIIIAFIIPLFEKRKNNKLRSTLYLYAFTTGFFIVLGLFGEVTEGKELAVEAATLVDPNNIWLSIGYQIIVLLFGSIIGLCSALALKYFVSKKWGKFNSNFPIEEHSDHDAFHNHPHIHEFFFAKQKPNDRNGNYIKTKSTALYLILFHRLAAGLFLGYIVYNLVALNYNEHSVVSDRSSGINLAFLIGFFLHLIPEETIVYYRQREMGIKRNRSILNSILMILILIPFIFLGANIGQFVSEIWWLNAIIHIIVGVLFVFTALVEFFPEVIKESTTQKKWYISILMLIIGIATCFVFISFGG